MRLEDGTDDEEHDTHTHGRDEQRGFATQAIDHKKDKDGRRNHLDNTVDARGEQGIGSSRIPNLQCAFREPCKFTIRGREPTLR